MRYRLLGHTGLRVSELCLGTMTFGEDWGFGAPPEECRRIFDAFAAAGGNFIDTANHYTNGASERIVGDLVRGERDRFVLATKYTLGTPGSGPNAGGNQRKNLVRSLEASLKRLGTDHVDLYWVHAWDPLTPIEETLRALDDMVRAGKVLYTGISDAPAWVVARADAIAAAHGWTRFAAVQMQYSLVERSVEREVLPMAAALDLALTAWAPLGGGVLTGKYGSGRAEGARFTDNPSAPAFVNERTLGIARVVGEVAAATGLSASQVALAWLRAQPGLVIPIVGARRLAQIEDNLGCLAATLPADALARLDEASRIPLGFPHDFLALPFVREIVYAGAYAQIDNHRAAGRR